MPKCNLDLAFIFTFIFFKSPRLIKDDFKISSSININNSSKLYLFVVLISRWTSNKRWTDFPTHIFFSLINRYHHRFLLLNDSVSLIDLSVDIFLFGKSLMILRYKSLDSSSARSSIDSESINSILIFDNDLYFLIFSIILPLLCWIAWIVNVWSVTLYWRILSQSWSKLSVINSVFLIMN